MPIKNIRPALNPKELFNVKAVQAALGVSAKTLRKYREQGLIFPINPGSERPRFSGESIMQCWDKAICL